MYIYIYIYISIYLSTHVDLCLLPALCNYLIMDMHLFVYVMSSCLLPLAHGLAFLNVIMYMHMHTYRSLLS